ncbi:dicarboxylate/amino acid:cation symporter [Sporolituus thermophilus]|uniref:Sodium:dicarboxylate symporter family protein n=1 Tax=Sporolituus thermophilus DSM 23256 TaxID=1123285 RepID=A0A1G7IN65_9FIRM|nr:dicarboxylate/amino acid:cation symporter [Sporolituus thermophilus]SDF13976.1 Sodium:dicarboxylate symporter family protein [Sporolituus thermophilus DSM 23256]
MKQYQKLLLGFILGIVAGLIGYYFLPQKTYPFMKTFTDFCTLTGAIFLRMIFMVVVPLLVSALILGVYELGKGRNLGKVAGRSIAFTLVLSFLAVIIAVSLTSILQPGVGVTFDKAELAKNQGVLTISKNVEAAKNKPWYQYFIELIPQNPVDSAARAFGGEIIALMVFSLIFGYALSMIVTDENNPLIKMLDTIFNASLKVIEWAMLLAPYGIFAIVFNTTYRLGAGFLQNVAYFAGVVVLGLLIQQFVVYGSFLKIFAKTNPWEFFKNCKEVYVYAFSTASSNATLPIALEAAEKTLKMPPQIARFVLTCGASANQNGTALFEGVVVLFLAQVYGINLPLESQLVVVLMSVLAGVGTAGVPGGSLPLIAILCVSVGVPAEGMGLILGVDRFLDMCRTTLNVSGDLVITKLVSATVSQKDIEAAKSFEC